MRNWIVATLIGLLAVFFFSQGITRGKEEKPRAYPPASIVEAPPPIRFSSAAADTFLLGTWDFDNGAGGPDAQGWVSADRTIFDNHFHVDNFAGLANYAPLEGTQSLWCGTRPGDPRTCHFKNLPGYGNDWWEFFESRSFSTTGDVTITYLISHDAEPGYDFTTTQYLSKSNIWQSLASFDVIGRSIQSHTVPADSLMGQAKFRFQFLSDRAYSDEDSFYVSTNGAVLIDSITVSDTMGVLDFQDFEAEAVGDTITADGDWQTTILTPFGDYAGLFDGATVLQEDSLVTNNTYFWGFFNGSTDTYGKGNDRPFCGGCVEHPEQLAIPFGPGFISLQLGCGSRNDYLDNEIWSPTIDFEQDVGGMSIPQGASTILALDLYPDIDNGGAVFFGAVVRSSVQGCLGSWRWTVLSGTYGKNWNRFTADIGDLIDPDAEAIQVGIRVCDTFYLNFWCDSSCLYGLCHRHGPLIDNVEVMRVDTTTATGLPDDRVVPRAFALHQNSPNPFNPFTAITYEIPIGGGQVDISIYDVAGRRVRQLVNGIASSGRKTITWNGRNDRGRPVASGVYFYRLTARNFTATRKMVLMK